MNQEAFAGHVYTALGEIVTGIMPDRLRNPNMTVMRVSLPDSLGIAGTVHCAGGLDYEHV